MAIVIGTIGLKIQLKSGIDISAASVIQLRYNKPDGTPGFFSGTYELSGTDHSAYYTTTAAADLDQEGKWTFQLYVEEGTNKFYGQEVKTEKIVSQLSV